MFVQKTQAYIVDEIDTCARKSCSRRTLMKLTIGRPSKLLRTKNRLSEFHSEFDVLKGRLFSNAARGNPIIEI